jgi:hypothetical protein
LPENQWEKVRLYKDGSKAAKIIESSQRPGTDGDEVIRQAASGGTANVAKAIELIDEAREFLSSNR